MRNTPNSATRVSLRLLVVTVCAVIGAAACSDQGGLEEPFASLIPRCEQTTLAPQLKDEEQTGEVNSRFARRTCEGTDFKVIMDIQEFGSEAEAAASINREFTDDFGNVKSDISTSVSAAYPVDDFAATDVSFIPDLFYGQDVARDFGFNEGDGFKQSWLQFRRGRYVGSYQTSAKGDEVLRDANFPDGYVAGGDSHPELAERLMNDTLSRWKLN